ncbi:apolipoprotein L1 isoform X2 [Etheostoma spectabile]|uniref:apolipoprotein L1 isoform X2 n=1 Tax=Etheostoma spectabile TaxID=54343 RepID=UPI0013AE8A56|nr:apolipoprotein L1-like isoform X2 [Etheostoma spectabile]
MNRYDNLDLELECDGGAETGGVFSGMFKKSPKPFGARTQSQDDLSVDKKLSASSDSLIETSSKPVKQTNSEVVDPAASGGQSSGDKQVKSNMIQHETKERSETPVVPPRPTEEEMKRTSSYAKVKAKGTEDNQDNQAMISSSARPSGSQQTKVKKHQHDPSMPHAGAKPQSDDEGLKEEDDSSPKEEQHVEEGQDKTETKVKKPQVKRHNPFMPRGKGKSIQRNAPDGAASKTAENEGGNRSLFDQLEDFSPDPAQPEDRQGVEDLMDWWNTVESWEDTFQEDDMTDKEEAKAFAVTADKVRKGIRVFNKLFSERAESLWQHVMDLNSIADGLDKFSKNTKIAQITGGSTSALGGVATITGLALAPFTMGTSLIVTAVGLGVATAGGLTSAGAGISNQVNNSMDRKKVEKIVQDYQEKMDDLNKCLTFVKQGIENLRRFDLIKMKKHAYNRDFPALNFNFYEDGAMAGKAILNNANEIMRVVQIANMAGSTAARAVQIASMATGVLAGLFVGMDIYFVAKDSKELKKGAKSEFAAKIREVALQLHDGLVELNGIRGELQTTTPDTHTRINTAAVDSEKKEKNDSSSEDEINHIKKEYENRVYV